MRIEIYDTTLRDGAQGEGVSFSLVDKNNITNKLNALGVDFIEGGYPLSNPKDVAYFDQCRVLNLTNSRICAFGMTRRRGLEAEQDEGMKALVATGASVITLVGKSWDLHVDEVLQVDRDHIRHAGQLRNVARELALAPGACGPHRGAQLRHAAAQRAGRVAVDAEPVSGARAGRANKPGFITRINICSSAERG